MDKLKGELLQAQKTRDDLMKWKLVLVAAIGSVGLGLTGAPGSGHPELVLCVIPLACGYADLLCRNLSVRTKLLSAFLSIESKRHPDDATARYEVFYQHFDGLRRGDKNKEDALEGIALLYSTRIMSGAIALVGLIALAYAIGLRQAAGASALRQATVDVVWPSLLFFASGVTGCLLSWWVEHKYKAQRRHIDGTAGWWVKECSSPTTAPPTGGPRST